jgi:hypothetical protein
MTGAAATFLVRQHFLLDETGAQTAPVRDAA